MENDKKLAAPYVPFQTFITALDSAAANSIPNIIDRSSFPSFSGAAVTAVISAFKFLGLTDEDGIPTELLHELAMQKDNRKKIMRGILEKHYSNLIELDLSRVTPSQFESQFSSEIYNVNGDTKIKSKTFFIKAAQFADIPISKLLLQRSRSSKKRKTANEKSADLFDGVADTSQSNKTPDTPTPPASDGTTKTVVLRAGGQLTLSANINLLELKGKDRAFVFKLIDLLDEYETEVQETESKPTSAQPIDLKEFVENLSPKTDD